MNWTKRKKRVKRKRKVKKRSSRMRIVKVNFFDIRHKRENTSEVSFGICDTPNTSPAPAYIDIINANSWIARITNTQGKDVQFLPVDKNIPIFRQDGTMASRCDCIMFPKTGNKQDIIFIELKERTDKNRVWRKKGVDQLSETIKKFVSIHSLKVYKSRRAIVANNKRPNYNFSNHEEKAKFAREHHGIILLVTPNITI